jgi:hypothetical protein
LTKNLTTLCDKFLNVGQSGVTAYEMQTVIMTTEAAYLDPPLSQCLSANINGYISFLNESGTSITELVLDRNKLRLKPCFGKLDFSTDVRHVLHVKLRLAMAALIDSPLVNSLSALSGNLSASMLSDVAHMAMDQTSAIRVRLPVPASYALTRRVAGVVRTSIKGLTEGDATDVAEFALGRLEAFVRKFAGRRSLDEQNDRLIPIESIGSLAGRIFRHSAVQISHRLVQRRAA